MPAMEARGDIARQSRLWGGVGPQENSGRSSSQVHFLLSQLKDEFIWKCSGPLLFVSVAFEHSRRKDCSLLSF
jgi:hypothetical protein